MTKVTALIVAASASMIAAPAYACDTTEDLPILPGESKELFEKRYWPTQKDLSLIRSFEHQRDVLAKAPTAWVGQVLSRKELSTQFLYTVTVRPVYAIKGKLPKGSPVLADTLDTSCGPHGDGGATSARDGEWVIVFSGLEKSQSRPNGLDSIRAVDALTGDLIGALWKVGRDPEE